MGRQSGLTVEQRAEAVLSLAGCAEPAAKIARRFGISEPTLYRYHDLFLEAGKTIPANPAGHRAMLRPVFVTPGLATTSIKHAGIRQSTKFLRRTARHRAIGRRGRRCGCPLLTITSKILGTAPPNEEISNHRWLSLLSEANWRRIMKRLTLSKRQAEVAALLCRECLVSEVARESGISSDAARHHSMALFRELGVRSWVGVVLRFV